MHLAGAKRGRRRSKLASATVDVARLRQTDVILLSVLPHPTIPAIASSLMQFCSDTT
jgi:hypothetical protein